MFGLLLVTGNLTHQESYARALAADPRCQLIGLTDEADLPPRRQELNRQLAAELEIPFLPDLDEALARPDVHLVSVCAETERRGPITARCARAGKHLYLDKEIATTVAEVQEVVAAVQAAGVFSQTFSLVHAPAATRARQALRQGGLGALLGLHCELTFAKGCGGTAELAQPRREVFPAERFSFVDSKRELLCVGWYPLVLFGWLTGRRVTRVMASTSNYFFAEHQRNDVEDFACLLLEYEDGLQGTITVGRTGWSSHPSLGVHVVHLVGSAAAMSIDAFRPRLEIHADVPPWQQPATPHPEDPMGFWMSTQAVGGVHPKNSWRPIPGDLKTDASHFLDCLEQGRDSEVNAVAGAHVVEVILAAYEAAATGRPVDL